MSNVAEAAPLVFVRRAILVHDLAGYTRASQRTDAMALAQFLAAYYSRCSAAASAAGGRVVKFMGDACLAVFPVERCAELVEEADRLRDDVPRLAREHHLTMLGPGTVSIHLAQIVEGSLSVDAPFDIVGEGVNHTFLLARGRGPGLHISEPVYRQLPNERRGRFAKHKPPAVYSLRD